jgi:hypothetical protein
MTLDAKQAADALEAMRVSRERLAAAANCPPARHLAFAAVLGGMVAAQAAPSIFATLIEAMLMVGIALIVAWDRKRTGMFINGYRAGRTQGLTFGLLFFSLAILALVVWLKLERGLVWPALAGGAVVAVVAYVASTVWQNIYLRELRETP